MKNTKSFCLSCALILVMSCAGNKDEAAEEPAYEKRNISIVVEPDNAGEASPSMEVHALEKIHDGFFDHGQPISPLVGPGGFPGPIALSAPPPVVPILPLPIDALIHDDHRKSHGVDCDPSVEDDLEERFLTFHDLDFRVFNEQIWEDLDLSHDEDVIVHFPSGFIREGLENHISDLSSLFVWAPDLHVAEHVVEFGRCEYTFAMSILEGTFTEPMPDGQGGFIEPTNQHFEFLFTTLGRWKNGRMVEEWLFWDNEEWSRQLGLCTGPTLLCQ